VVDRSTADDHAHFPISQANRESKGHPGQAGHQQRRTVYSTRLIILLSRILLLGFGILNCDHGTLQAQDARSENENSTVPPLLDDKTRLEFRVPLLPGRVFRTNMSHPPRWADWRSGSWMEAEFSCPVYSGGQIAIPAKSRLVFEIS